MPSVVAMSQQPSNDPTEARYERLWTDFKELRNAQSQAEFEVELDGILAALARKITYNDERNQT